jgi:peroxiredoxin
LKLFGQQVKIFKLGRQPAQMLIDKKGILRFVHYGHSMKDIPSPAEMIALLDQLQQEQQ